MSQPDDPEDDKETSVDNTSNTSESAFEFLLARILLQPASQSLNISNDLNEIQLHPFDILGYDVGYR